MLKETWRFGSDESAGSDGTSADLEEGGQLLEPTAKPKRFPASFEKEEYVVSELTVGSFAGKSKDACVKNFNASSYGESVETEDGLTWDDNRGGVISIKNSKLLFINTGIDHPKYSNTFFENCQYFSFVPGKGGASLLKSDGDSRKNFLFCRSCNSSAFIFCGEVTEKKGNLADAMLEEKEVKDEERSPLSTLIFELVDFEELISDGGVFCSMVLQHKELIGVKMSKVTIEYK